MYGANAMNCHDFIPNWADINLGINADEISVCLTGYEVAFIIFPVLHNFTLPCMGRKNAMLVSCLVQAVM